MENVVTIDYLEIKENVCIIEKRSILHLKESTYKREYVYNLQKENRASPYILYLHVFYLVRSAWTNICRRQVGCAVYGSWLRISSARRSFVVTRVAFFKLPKEMIDPAGGCQNVGRWRDSTRN